MDLLGFLRRLTARRWQEMRPPGRYYFMSWRGYEIPLRPDREINAEAAEELEAYCIGDYGEDHRLESFEKWLVSGRTEIDRGLLPTRADSETPGRVGFYEVTFSSHPQPTPGEPMELKEALVHKRYIRVGFLGDGCPPNGRLIEKKQTFHHEYRYWPNGHLQSWKYLEHDQPGEVLFDPQGRPESSGRPDPGGGLPPDPPPVLIH